jgi:alkanesulfonate monooxygenase SsuD/methylene tetrahydromethanopterin reductase-like flavin-dependent oxidoreductase (luciferase family)
VDIGVGHGVQEWMAQVGARVESPMTLLGEYLTALRALLRGERVTVDGRYLRLDAVALDWPPASPPAVLAGATGPRSLRLSGRRRDHPHRSHAARAGAAGTPPGGRGGAPRAAAPTHRVAVYVLAATGPGGAGRLGG